LHGWTSAKPMWRLRNRPSNTDILPWTPCPVVESDGTLVVLLWFSLFCIEATKTASKSDKLGLPRQPWLAVHGRDGPGFSLVLAQVPALFLATAGNRRVIKYGPLKRRAFVDRVKGCEEMSKGDWPYTLSKPRSTYPIACLHCFSLSFEYELTIGLSGGLLWPSLSLAVFLLADLAYANVYAGSVFISEFVLYLLVYHSSF
jgi:hypothetical protein